MFVRVNQCSNLQFFIVSISRASISCQSELSLLFLHSFLSINMRRKAVPNVGRSFQITKMVEVTATAFSSVEESKSVQQSEMQGGFVDVEKKL